ncbi:MAG TPA: energy transducer TonB [Flavobacteriales bacterium]
MRHPFLLSLALLLPVVCAAQGPDTPQPLGGMDAVKWFLEDELVFPAAALAEDAEGGTVVGFIVTSTGEVASVGVVKAFRPDCDAEAVRLAKLVRWTPASVGGTPQHAPKELVVPFSAKKYRKLLSRKDRCPRLVLTTPAQGGDTVYTKGLDSLATPLVPKGIRGLPQYLAENLRYPEEARRRDIQGKVTIEFIVETSGAVSNLRATGFLGAGCDEEARRLAHTICWRPAIRKGQRVRSEFKLDIQFRLDNYQRP